MIFIVFFTNAQLPKNIKFTNYTRANGLPEERVNDITQDSRGFLWMGTVEGLHRFDGQHYKSWYANPNDSATFSNNNILIIGEYRPGFILFSSANKLWELNITNHQLKIVEQFKNTQIVSTPVQLNETQWFFATYDSLFIISKNFKTEYAIALKNYYPNLSQVYLIKLNYPYAILQSPNANKFYLFNYVNKKITPISFDNTQAKKTNAFYINNYDSINNKLILHAYFDGAFYCELKIPEQTFYKPILILDINNGAIQKSILLPNSQLMFASANGLYISDYSKSILYKQNKINDNSLVNDAITNIYKSRNNDYWLSTNKGVSKFSLAQSTIQYWSNELKMPIEDDFKSIVKGNDGNLYFLNRELGLSQFNPTTKQIKK